MNWLALVMLPGLLVAGALEADDLTELANASRAAAKAFGTQLRSELQHAIEAGGLANGVAVCHEKAPAIADAVSQATGLKVRRASLKARNSRNAPDEWERAMLQRFDVRRAAGEPLDTLEAYEVVGQGDARTFRYMKAIPTEKVCLACHGETLAPAVEAKLDELYPNDAARGFQEGDLRGAFSISRPF